MENGTFSTEDGPAKILRIIFSRKDELKTCGSVKHTGDVSEDLVNGVLPTLPKSRYEHRTHNFPP